MNRRTLEANVIASLIIMIGCVLSAETYPVVAGLIEAILAMNVLISYRLLEGMSR